MQCYLHSGDRLKFLSVEKDFSPGRSRAGRHFHTCQCEQYIMSVIKPLMCSDPRYEFHINVHVVFFKEEAKLLNMMHEL